MAKNNGATYHEQANSYHPANATGTNVRKIIDVGHKRIVFARALTPADLDC